MEVVILAGGLGTRLSEETYIKPKPMVEINGMPLIWHIMKTYERYEITEFIVCLGYKGAILRDYFINYVSRFSDIEVDLRDNALKIHNKTKENWTIKLIDTGIDTNTGGRLKKVQKYITGKTFCMTYGDGLANIDFNDEIMFHNSHGKLATVAAVTSPARFGNLKIGTNNKVQTFEEKNSNINEKINAGFFVLDVGIFNYIDGDEISFEHHTLKKMAQIGELIAYKHDKFWKPCDTLRDLKDLELMSKQIPVPWFS